MLPIRMTLQSIRRISTLLTLLCFNVNAQITLPTITGCIGNPAGTATYTTDLSIASGSERIVAGDFWNQLGAVWIFSTDTEGIEFSAPGIPGYGAGFGGGGPPAAAESAIALDSSKTAWTLSIPASSLGWEWDIVFEASTPTSTSAVAASSSSVGPQSSAASASSSSPATPPAAASSTIAPSPAAKIRRYEPARPVQVEIQDAAAAKITSTPRRPRKPRPVGANFRRQAASGQFHLIINGSLPCLGPVISSQTVSGNPTIASSCVNNEISTEPAEWTTYGVSSVSTIYQRMTH